MNAERVAGHLVDWLRSQVEAAGAGGLVFGLSGGVDSAVVGRLARDAYLEAHLALILPIRSDHRDLQDARLAVEALHLSAKEIVLDAVYEQFASSLGVSFADSGALDLPLANLKARLRMTALYYYANRYSYLVVGTGNRSELTLGYFTKYGDGGVDLLPLGHLVKSEVRALAQQLGVPDSIIAKAPAAGIWPGLTDEGELGFNYEQLEEYLLGGTGEEIRENIEARRRANAHKLRTPKLPPPSSAMDR